MPNYISFTSPGSGNFTVSAAYEEQSPPYDETWTIVQSGTTVLKFYASGTTTPEIPQANLVVGNYYDVYAFESNGTTPKDVDWSGTNIEFIDSFNYGVDGRPIFQGGYATQKYSNTGDITYGTPNAIYRATPATGDPMNNQLTNGKLRWLTDKVKPAADRGFERFHITNIAGWTSFSNAGTNDQPHFPSNSYTGLSLTSVPVFTSANDATNPIIQATPFTDTGLSTGTPGDNKEAWAEGIAQLKSWVTTATPAATPEITSYQGYRPCYGDVNMNTFRKDILGYSKSSTNAAGWTGTGNSPGFTPEPGFDGPLGVTKNPSAMAAWFDEEFIGLRSLGFDGIALDTGTRVYDNAAGYANGTIPAGISNPDGTSSSNALVNYFNSWGIKPTFEAVGLDTWTDGTGKLAIPATDGRYAASAYCALFGAWWGYEGNANGEQVVTANFDKAGTGTVEAPSGGYFFGDAVGGPKVGNGANAAAFTAEAEVHCIFQWGAGTYLTRLMQGTAGDAESGNGVGWLGMKQIMWDFHTAGLIVSASGSMTADITVTDPVTGAVEIITPEMFMDFVLSLYTNSGQSRPNGIDWDTYTDGRFYDIGFNGTQSTAAEYVDPSTAYASTAATFGVLRDANYNMTVRYWNTNAGDTVAPYAALYSHSIGQWLGWASTSAQTGANNYSAVYDQTGYDVEQGTATTDFCPSTGTDECTVVLLSQEPTNMTDWTAPPTS